VQTAKYTTFKLLPHQGLQGPWLPASFTDTLGTSTSQIQR